MKIYLLTFLVFIAPIKSMEEQAVEEQIPARPNEHLAQGERHHSMRITMTEDDIFGPLPASPKTIRHMNQLKKLRWGLAISIISGLGMSLAAFFGAFFGRPCH